MFGRKYVFESKATRLRRLLISGGVFLSISLIAILTFIAYIPIYAKMQKGRSTGAFYQKSPDAIAVFTGDKGRIAYAIDVLKKNPSSKLFISGVHAANSFQTLVDKQANITEEDDDDSDIKNPGMQIDLDYESKNTFQNVRETVEFLQANPQIKRILIISSDYHIMRINLILSHLTSKSKPEFFYDAVVTDYSSWNNQRKLLKEAVKLVRTLFLVKVLREDIVTEE
jgi:uncharacterized SAM-binding protein YcdF (DUF218 family)